MSITHVCICAPQVPFVDGGTEAHVAGLERALNERGFQATTVRLPFKWYPKQQVLLDCLAWRLIDLTEANGVKIDRVIATKFPSYAVRHPNKVTWLIHQFRQVYDLFGTEFSEFGSTPTDLAIRDAIVRLDARTLREAHRLYSISRNVARRLAAHNGLTAIPLPVPPPLDGRYRTERYGDFVLSVGRLDRMKRTHLLIEALARVPGDFRAFIVGTGPEEEALRRLAHRLGVSDRVRFLGRVSDEELLRLYATCRAVFYAPYDEDYGLVTLEAFKSAKPVVTTEDAGGVLEFVEHQRSGFVSSVSAEGIADALRRVAESPSLCAELGRAGAERVSDVTWDRVVAALTE